VLTVIAAIGFGIYFGVDETPNLVLVRLSYAGAIVAGLALALYALAYLLDRDWPRGGPGPPVGP
jgi:hypothetical protein